MYIELHILQNFVPANLNRDDSGNPKDCLFGGYRRARISSQCFKRAIRECPSFNNETGVDQGKRTKNLVAILMKELSDCGDQDKVKEAVIKFVEEFYAGMDKKNKDKTEVLVYVSKAERDLICSEIREIIQRGGDEKEIAALSKELTKRISRNFSTAPDIALFGRMLASAPEKNIEASCQVAHAISTNAVKMEMDFYTAQEEHPVEDNPGAAMMGFTTLNSSCFYRYARVHYSDLVKNLAEDNELARKTVRAFIRSAVEAVPSGKQNATAALNPPGFIMAVIRKDGMGWNLANAFEKPVRPVHTESLTDNSAKALLTYYNRLFTVYEGEILSEVILNNTGLEEPSVPEKSVVVEKFSQLTTKVIEEISKQGK